jgi:hypothetical protein
LTLTTLAKATNLNGRLLVKSYFIHMVIKLEVYPSPAEGIGLENRQAGQTARGFESLYLLHIIAYIIG